MNNNLDQLIHNFVVDILMQYLRERQEGAFMNVSGNLTGERLQASKEGIVRQLGRSNTMQELERKITEVIYQELPITDTKLNEYRVGK